MPTQECTCKDCNQTFTHLLFKGDDTPPTCPACKGKNISKKEAQQGFMAKSSIGSHIVGVPRGPS